MKKIGVLVLMLALILPMTAVHADKIISNEFTFHGKVTDRPEEVLPVPEAEPEAQARSAVLHASKAADTLAMGDEVTLTAVLEGYEGADVQIAWESNVDGNWRPTGDTGSTLTIVIDENNAQSLWRFKVTVLASGGEKDGASE